MHSFSMKSLISMLCFFLKNIEQQQQKCLAINFTTKSIQAIEEWLHYSSNKWVYLTDANLAIKIKTTKKNGANMAHGVREVTKIKCKIHQWEKEEFVFFFSIDKSNASIFAYLYIQHGEQLRVRVCVCVAHTCGII